MSMKSKPTLKTDIVGLNAHFRQVIEEKTVRDIFIILINHESNN
jgi:hypothetical protein